MVEAAKIAEAGFIYGFPIVMNYGVLYDFVIDRIPASTRGRSTRSSTGARLHLGHVGRRAEQRHAYSMLWLDLGAEPMIISVPAVDPKRYYSVQLVDGNTYNWHGYIGSRATGSDAGDYMVVGPNWRARRRRGSEGLPRDHALRTDDLPHAIVRSRTWTTSRRCRPATRRSPCRPISNSRKPPRFRGQFPTINKRLAKRNFFEYLDFAPCSLRQPRRMRPKSARSSPRSASEPGKENFRDLSLKDKIEIGIGMKLGQRKLEQKVKSVGKNINGWQVGSVFGDADFFNGDWLLRAAAQMGIYGNNAEEAMYPATRSDVDGNPLDGKNNYTLTFPQGNCRR